ALGRTSRWHHVDHEALLAIAADPAKHPLLQPRDIEIRSDKDRTYASLQLVAKNKGDELVAEDLLSSIIRLVGLVHADTPAGHPARADMPALIKQTTKLLDSPSTLLHLRGVFIYDTPRKKGPKPSEWLDKFVGKTKAGGKDGIVRFDDG